MSRLFTWCVGRVAAMLPRDEADAVLGDLVEMQREGWSALRDVGGLLVRRQLDLWRHWRPWVSALLIAPFIGLTLSLLTRRWGASGAVETWIYVDNWTWYHLASPGARGALAATIAGQLLDACTLAGWAWTTGYVLGHVSSGTRWLSGGLLMALVMCTVWGPVSSASAGNAVVFESWFYRTVYPLGFRTALVCVPLVGGLCRAPAGQPLSARVSTLGAVVLIALTIRASLDVWRVAMPLLGPAGIVVVALGVLAPMIYLTAQAWAPRVAGIESR